jgi:predicted regulator of Ras-like GTPase activity (Roadblock/LC7/MglB family)
MSREEALKSVVNSLRSAVPDIQGVLVASTDGLPIIHSVSNGSDPNRVAAMAATALGVGKRISESLSAGAFAETMVRGIAGQVFIYAAGPRAVLTVIAGQDGNVGLIQMESRDAAAAVAAAL